ncbi:hypothetical protein BC629DRAFT_1583769 [Irpex lacteus]|nr:hypothetical protein BC629DRAFT_1583769 [Irpex lacteus]
MPDPEDLLSDSLQTLYDYTPITHSSAGSIFQYNPPKDPLPSTYPRGQSCTITLTTPTTRAANWSLHASSIWASSIYIADHLPDLHLDRHIEIAARETNSDGSSRRLRILELGAGAGLPSILIAKLYDAADVTVSDYPDEELIKTLADNVTRNDVARNCRASSVLSHPNASIDPTFDVIIAADTLWNSQLHPLFLDALGKTLRKSAGARIFLVAGLHTGRYTLQAFMNSVRSGAFELMSRRAWDVERQEQEDEKERRKWVVWMVLKWKDSVISHGVQYA